MLVRLRVRLPVVDIAGVVQLRLAGLVVALVISASPLLFLQLPHWTDW